MHKSFSQRMFLSKSHCPSTKEDYIMTKLKNSTSQHLLNSAIKQNNMFNRTTKRGWDLFDEYKQQRETAKAKEAMEFPQAKALHCSKGKVAMFASNSFKGRLRSYNEDRLAIECNVQRPQGKAVSNYWPRIDYFAVFDGHGGDKCSEYLKANLLSFIINDVSFPDEPIEAIKSAFSKADAYLLKEEMVSYDNNNFDSSGSCGLILLIIRDFCYCVNLGDSRSIYSENSSHRVKQLSIEHKPNINDEKERILLAGGSIFKTETFINNEDTITWRILPGQLAVSRSFGDIEAKSSRFGGNPSVLISSPDITVFQLNNKSDFIVLGSDGIFDNFPNREIIKHIWKTKRDKERLANYSNRQIVGEITDSIMTKAMDNGSNDNVSCIFIAFGNFFKQYDQYPSLKYIDQVNCDQVLSKSVSNCEERQEEAHIIQPLVYRIRKKPKTYINFNVTLNKYTFNNKLNKKEDTLILNSCQSNKVSKSGKKNYILPIVKARMVN